LKLISARGAETEDHASAVAAASNAIKSIGEIKLTKIPLGMRRSFGEELKGFIARREKGVALLKGYADHLTNSCDTEDTSKVNADDARFYVLTSAAYVGYVQSLYAKHQAVAAQHQLSRIQNKENNQE
jgi:hypothetical protein